MRLWCARSGLHSSVVCCAVVEGVNIIGAGTHNRLEGFQVGGFPGWGGVEQ